MTEYVMSSVVATLGDLLTQEAKLFLGVEGDVKRLQEELRRMQGFLKDVDARQDEDEFPKDLLSEIRNAAYAAEDAVEIYALKSASNRTERAINVLKQLAGIHTDHEFGSEIDRITNLTQRLQSIGMRVTSQGEGSSSLHERQREQMRSDPHIVEDIVVRIEKNVEESVKYSVAEETNHHVVCICGVGGLGKTTLVDPRGIIYQSQLLNREDSWEWLQKIARSGRDCADFNIDERMEELGKKMVFYCQGFPLAITVLGGILATKYSSNEWKMVLDNIASYFMRWDGRGSSIEELNPVQHILTLSYVDLPMWLKPCFLYLSQFPEEYEINVNKLIRLWIAEGFVQPVPHTGEEEKMLEDVAECYLNDLVQRCMVLVGERDSNLRIKTCRLHALMRDMCLSKAKNEFSVCIIDDRHVDENVSIFSLLSTSRRLAVHLHGHSCQFALDYITSRHLRSLLCFYDFSYQSWRLHKLVFDNLKLLRVLDLEGADIGEGNLPKDVGELIHLRFLSLRHARVSKIPSSLGNLRYLQTLDLLIEGTIMHVPNVIWKMERLRHLYLPVFCDAKTKLQLNNLTNLLTLVNFPAQNCDVRDLFSMTNLRELTIRDPISIKNFTKFSKSLSMRLKHLQALSLDNSYEEDDKKTTKFEDLFSMSFGDFMTQGFS